MFSSPPYLPAAQRCPAQGGRERIAGGSSSGCPWAEAGGQPAGAACRNADAGPEHVAGRSSGERTWAAGGWAAGGRGLPECRHRARARGVRRRLVQHGRLRPKVRRWSCCGQRGPWWVFFVVRRSGSANGRSFPSMRRVPEGDGDAEDRHLERVLCLFPL
ncbi:unnamed protein product [Urochloa humidicola]